MQVEFRKSIKCCDKVNCFKARVREPHYHLDSVNESSPDSSISRRRIFQCQETQCQNSCSCTESDESEELEEGANSESGAESIETDSVFFDNLPTNQNDGAVTQHRLIHSSHIDQQNCFNNQYQLYDDINSGIH